MASDLRRRICGAVNRSGGVNSVMLMGRREFNEDRWVRMVGLRVCGREGMTGIMGCRSGMKHLGL